GGRRHPASEGRTGLRRGRTVAALVAVRVLLTFAFSLISTIKIVTLNCLRHPTSTPSNWAPRCHPLRGHGVTCPYCRKRVAARRLRQFARRPRAGREPARPCAGDARRGAHGGA